MITTGRMCPLNQLCAPRHGGRGGKNNGPGPSPSSTTSSLSWLVDKELHLFVDLCPNRISWLVLQMPAFSWSKINDDEEEDGNDHLDNDHNDERTCWQIALLITMIVILCLMIRYIDNKENYKDDDHQVVTKWSQMAVIAIILCKSFFFLASSAKSVFIQET